MVFVLLFLACIFFIYTRLKNFPIYAIIIKSNPKEVPFTKYLLVIGDGMADDPVPQLGNKTPLQTAAIPTIDRMAGMGLVGSVVNCPSPLPAGSETAILSIFGCDPRQYFTGRSPMEAAAAGIAMRPGDAAFRCNLVSFEDRDMPMEEKRILSHSAGSIDGESALATVEALLSEPRFAKALEEARMEIHRFPAFRQIAVSMRAISAEFSSHRLTTIWESLSDSTFPLGMHGHRFLQI